MSLRICVQFWAIKGNFFIFSDLLSKNHGVLHRLLPLSTIMADLLHQNLKSMSIGDDEEPLTLPDSPRFRVFDENSISLLGRLLNPDCQPMANMIETCRLHDVCMEELDALLCYFLLYDVTPQ